MLAYGEPTYIIFQSNFHRWFNFAFIMHDLLPITNISDIFIGSYIYLGKNIYTKRALEVIFPPKRRYR